MLSTTIALNADSSAPLHRQLYSGLRDAILSGRLAAGARLPATRALASELAISRNTVLDAYAQLMAEGYVTGQIGSGTYVAHALPEDLLQVHSSARPQPPEQPSPTSQPARALSRRGELIAKTPVTVLHYQTSKSLSPISFRPGQPALDTFPLDTWRRIVDRRWRRTPRELLGYGDPAGYLPLREVIAAYLRAARAVHCDARQVIVVSGSQQALDLSARLLLDEGDAAWIEDPGYIGARGALLGAGARAVPVPVDAEGLEIATGAARSPQARMVYVTPSHQYPLGVTMSLTRRLALLEWASRAGAWVLEDDYDSEYRYAGRPLSSLQGLDSASRVIYMGTFSKVMFPALRLGYLVAPPDLVDAFVAARALADRHTPSVEQAALAEFITDGHFARHIRRMRALYAERQATLVGEARRELAGLLEVAPAAGGRRRSRGLGAGRRPRRRGAGAIALRGRAAAARRAAAGLHQPGRAADP
jgi:GntR family transcriptional regulator/MocR family aminotransferase